MSVVRLKHSARAHFFCIGIPKYRSASAQICEKAPCFESQNVGRTSSDFCQLYLDVKRFAIALTNCRQYLQLLATSTACAVAADNDDRSDVAKDDSEIYRADEAVKKFARHSN